MQSAPSCIGTRLSLLCRAVVNPGAGCARSKKHNYSVTAGERGFGPREGDDLCRFALQDGAGSLWASTVAALVIAGSRPSRSSVTTTSLYRGARAHTEPSSRLSRSLRTSEGVEHLLARDDFFMSRRTAGTDPARRRCRPARFAQRRPAPLRGIKKELGAVDGPTTFNSAWPTTSARTRSCQVSRDSRNPALRRDGRPHRRACDPAGRHAHPRWRPGRHLGLERHCVGAKTDNLPSLAIGALAVAPSNDSVVYAGTGEGALSGDSYFGNGVLKSTNGGNTLVARFGRLLPRRLDVAARRRPDNANHLWVAVVRGRGGSRRTSPPVHSALRASGSRRTAASTGRS